MDNAAADALTIQAAAGYSMGLDLVAIAIFPFTNQIT